MRALGRVTVIAPPNSWRVEDMAGRSKWRITAQGRVDRAHRKMGAFLHVMRRPTRFRVRASLKRTASSPRRERACTPPPRPAPRPAHPFASPLTMQDLRRRSVMHPPSDLLGNGRGGSSIPMPSTAKKTHSGRMSMSGPAMRAPYPVPQFGPGPTPRASVMRSQNANPLLMSVSKPNMGRTPLHRYVAPRMLAVFV